MDFESLQCEFVMGCNEHDSWQGMKIKGREHAESVQTRHLHIQKYEVRPVLGDAVDRFSTRGGVGQKNNVRLAFEKPPDLEARRTLVVYYQGTYLCHRQFHDWNSELR